MYLNKQAKRKKIKQNTSKNEKEKISKYLEYKGERKTNKCKYSASGFLPRQLILSLCDAAVPTADWSYGCSSSFSEIFEVYKLFGLPLTVDKMD